MEYIGRLENDRKLQSSEACIVIFGAGKEFVKILDKLEKSNLKKNVICICDNDVKKQGKEISGIQIVSLDYALRYYKNAIYIVYNQFCIEICKQLSEQGIDRIHLIRS